MGLWSLYLALFLISTKPHSNYSSSSFPEGIFSLGTFWERTCKNCTIWYLGKKRGWDRLCLSPEKCLQGPESSGGSQECTHELQKGQEQSTGRSEADLGYIFWSFCFHISESQLQLMNVPYRMQFPLNPLGSFARGSWYGKMLIHSSRRSKMEIPFLPLKIGKEKNPC